MKSFFENHSDIVFLAVALLVMVGSLLLPGCAMTPQTPQLNPQQVQFVQACGAYGTAFQAAVALRQQGKLNSAQISQVTMLDAQITPLCTGKLPVSPQVEVQEVTNALTALAVMEAQYQSTNGVTKP